MNSFSVAHAQREKVQMTTGLSAVEKLSSSSKPVHRPKPNGLLYPWLILAVAFAALDFYRAPHSIGVDGVGYIDTALAYARGDWHTAINTYWSPLYCWLLASVLRFAPTNVATELPLVHAVNVLCFLFAFWTFHRFWSALKGAPAGDMETVSVPVLTPRLFDAFGYSLFLYLFVPLIRAVTADMLSSALVFLLAYELVDWRRRGECGVLRASALGALIALAFFAKAILLYFGLIALCCALFDRSLHRRMRSVAVAGTAIVVLILPWSASLRWATGEWSLGSSGKLNYAWFVNGAPTGIFQDIDGPPTAFFPGQRIRPGMKAFVLPTANGVTYMPWYDPGRLDHRKPQLVLGGQMRAVVKNLKWLRLWFLVEFAGILCILSALAIPHSRKWLRKVARYYYILIPCVAVFGMYTLIFVRSYRYIAAMTLLLFGIALVSVTPKIDSRRYLASIMLSGLCLFWITNVPGTVMAILQSPPDSRNNLLAAQALERAYPTDTKVAVIGEGAYAYWAHLARMRLVGEIWSNDATAFWTMPCSEREDILAKMRIAGARAAIGKPPENRRVEDWKRLGDSDLYALDLAGEPDIQCPMGQE